MEDIDQVAFAEYSEDGSELIITIPISFILTEQHEGINDV